MNDRTANSFHSLLSAFPISHSAIARAARRCRAPGAVLLLYLALAVVALSPLAPTAMPESGADDLGNHVSGIIEARNALAEGQFPIRVAPHQNLGTRYPIFQFYGNLPYTAGGLLYAATGLNPYLAWKIVVVASLVLGAFFTYRCGRALTRQALPAVTAGAVLLTAPYLLTDVHGRFAYPETVSFGLLPAVFYWSLRCFLSRRAWPVVAAAVCWDFLALSHAITFLYASLFFGLFFLSFPPTRRRACGRLARVGLAYGLGLCLSAWYVAPQRQLLPHLCGGILYPVWDAAWLTPLGVLLAPTVVTPVHVPSIYLDVPQHFGLQVGWPVLAAVGLVLCSLRAPFLARAGRRPLVARFLLLFFLAFFLVWTPFDFWSALPRLFAYVQFSYRLLMFVVLWGCLLVPAALVVAFRNGMGVNHLALCLLGLGLCTAPYLGPHRPGKRVSLEKELAHPNMGRGGANYVYNLSAGSLLRTSLVHPAVDWAAPPFGILDPVGQQESGVTAGAFPPLGPGDVLEVEGVVPAYCDGLTPLTVSADGQALETRQLLPGPFRLAIPAPGRVGLGPVLVGVQSPPRDEPPPEGPHTRLIRKPTHFLTRFALRRAYPGPGEGPIHRAEELRASAAQGHPTVFEVRLPQPGLVQLPVLFYPGLLRLSVNGVRVPPRNLGRFVALELPPGRHQIRVWFVGLRWANALSLAAWLTVGLAVAGLLVRRCGLLGRCLWRASGIATAVQVSPLRGR